MPNDKTIGLCPLCKGDINVGEEHICQGSQVVELDKQVENKPARDEYGRLLPGNTANPNGRPRGKTLKEWVREKLMDMTDEQREEFIKTLPKDIIWKMAEGNPEQKSETDMKHTGEISIRDLFDRSK